jgi:NAD-dependent dihydropyrimidine dehydrogenase PreA subunit/branched-subunit amino acid transport protein
MKAFKLKLILPVLSGILLAAHFSRAQNDWLAAACLVFPLILLSKKRWVMRIFQLFLLLGTVIWIERAVFLVQLRQRLQLPWVRLAIILGAAALFTALSSLVFNNKKIKEMFKKEQPESTTPAVIACVVTAGLLSIVQWKVKTPVILLMERFLPGAGWVEVLLLAIYAGWITEKIINPRKTPVVRSRTWALFSFVFFAQLILGLAGIEKLLMTGKLHLPVPALIIAGPVFRGEGFFMLILFGAAVLLAGPAWCGYLCYTGAWDNLAAKGKKTPAQMPRWRHPARVGILLAVLIAAAALRFSGVSWLTATWLAAGFGLLGVGIMVLFSRKLGVMTHCITYCPIGLAANWLGRISPFRLRITDTCTECSACRLACRYGALTIEDIKKRKPGLSCTLCGDCVTRCKEKSLQYKFLAMKPQTARTFFVIMTVSLHAVFLGAARL